MKADARLRVLHVITGLNQGGAENVLCRVVEALRDRCDFHVVSMMDDGDYGARLRAEGVTVSTLGMKRGLPTPGAFFRLRRLMKEWRPDVVQTWMYHADLLGGVAAWTAGVKRIVWGIRHSSLDPKVDSRKTIAIARLDAILSKWVPNAIVSCSEKARTLHAKLGYRERLMTVIPNGYPLDLFRREPEKGRAFREKLGIPQETLVFCNASRYDPQKDHAGLLSAFGRFRAARPDTDALLLLCGRNVDEQNPALAAKIRENGLENHVRLLGKQSDMPAFMNALDFLVLSSSHGEAFPNVLAEAMACGKPCVSTDVGDACDIVGETGWIVPPAQPQALADALLAASRESANSSEARGVAARERVASHYDIESVAEMYIRIWKPE